METAQVRSDTAGRPESPPTATKISPACTLRTMYLDASELATESCPSRTATEAAPAEFPCQRGISPPTYLTVIDGSCFTYSSKVRLRLRTPPVTNRVQPRVPTRDELLAASRISPRWADTLHGPSGFVHVVP